ncbi:MAG: BatA domain-containing protein [Phycisphaerae bacterium]|nr:BatA domain-containing protein [Phycisphaerae bacterium]
MGLFDHSMLAQSLLTPSLFTWGAAAVSLPILIHLFARRRFRRIRWAAMEFLVDAEKRNKRRMFIEELILLALRCLAILALAAMFARPFVSSDSVAAAWGGRQRVERVILVDDSFSMGYRSGEETVFDRARSAVTRLVDAFRRESPQDTVTLLRMSDIAAPVVAAATLDQAQYGEILTRLGALEPTQLPLGLSKVFEQTAAVLGEGGEVLNAVVYVVSDFQQKDWVRPAGAGGGSGGNLLEPLREWAGEERGLRVVLVNIGDENAVNQAVTDLVLPAGAVVAGTPVTLKGSVVRFADATAGDVELQLTLGTQGQPTQTISRLEPRQPNIVDFEVEFARPGSESIRLEIPDDGLPVDDTRFQAAEVVSAVRVLIVNGEPSSDALLDEAQLLSTALRPEGEVFSGFEPVVVDEAGFEDSRLGDYHVVVLANVFRVSPAMVSALDAFVADGGGLMVFGGDQVDPESYNTVLYQDGEGLLPARIGERIAPTEPVHLSITDRTHPAFRAMGVEGDPLGLGAVPFYEFHDIQLPEDNAGGEATTGAVGAVEAAPAEHQKADRGVRVVARFTDPERTPAIVERNFGRGRVILLGFPADKEWDTWPDHPTYLPVMLELVQHAATPAGLEGARLVGMPLEVSIDPSRYLPDAMLRTPSFPDEPEVPIRAVSAGENKGLVARWDFAGRAGVYQFVLRRQDGTEDVRMVPVNLDARESDLRMAGEPELRRAMPEPAFEYIVGLEGLDARSGDTRVELWRGLWVLVIVVLMAEQVLAFRWGRRR